MRPLTFSFIKNNWITSNGYFHNDLALDDTVADIDEILTIVDRIMTDGIKMPISLGKNVKRTSSLLNDLATFYDKQKPIVMSLSNGDEMEGIIRISNHEVDLKKCAESDDIDFSISFVLYESALAGNRMLCIYEYLNNAKRYNQSHMDLLVAIITNIKTHYTSRQMIKSVYPKSDE